MTDLPYSVRVTGPGLEMTKAVDQHVALRVLNVVFGGAQPSASGHVSPRDVPDPQAPELTVGEFLSELTIRNNQDRIAGIALYLREYLGEDRVPRDDLLAWFERAGEPAPKNLNRDLSQAVRKKLVAEDHQRPGEFFVTSTGEDRVKGTASPEKAAKQSRPPAKAVGESTAQKEKKGRHKRNASASGKGPTEWIRTLVEDDFFSVPRASAEIVAELARRGAHYKDSDLTRQLQALIQDGELKRSKQPREESGREVWHYQES